MKTKKYIGVTIGPIYKTIQFAKKTGELWGSSYIFSFMMKKIIENILIKHEKDNIKDRFIMPYVGQGFDDEIFKYSYKAGIFHDRFIFESKEKEFDSVNNIIEDVKNMVAEKVYEDISNYQKTIASYKKGINKDKFIEKINEIFTHGDIENTIKDAIKEYFQIYSVEVEISKDDNKNVIFEVSKYLDTIELNEKFINVEKENYLLYFLKNQIMRNSFLAIDAFGGSNLKNIGDKERLENYKSYPSLANIAMRDLLVNSDNEKEEDELRNLYKEERRKVHNYVAIVQVDGDGIGKIIENLKQDSKDNKQTFKGFSEILFNHAKDSVGSIEKYGGFTLYAGGDDLLFIAPIINRKSGNSCKNIFELIDLLSENFEKAFSVDSKKENEVTIKKPTLSFGMSIIHYKYPLYEALEDTRNLLFSLAKGYKCSKKNENNEVERIEKDAIAFKVIKHSGQYYGLTLNKKSKSYIKFKEILKKEMEIFNEKEDVSNGLINNLRTISNKLFEDETILNCIGYDLNMLKNYFDNSFNEDYHEKCEVKECINEIYNLIFEVYNEYMLEVDTKKIEELNKIFEDKKIKNRIYSYLKFIRFLGEKEKEDE